MAIPHWHCSLRESNAVCTSIPFFQWPVHAAVQTIAVAQVCFLDGGSFFSHVVHIPSGSFQNWRERDYLAQALVDPVCGANLFSEARCNCGMQVES